MKLNSSSRISKLYKGIPEQRHAAFTSWIITAFIGAGWCLIDYIMGTINYSRLSGLLSIIFGVTIGLAVMKSKLSIIVEKLYNEIPEEGHAMFTFWFITAFILVSWCLVDYIIGAVDYSRLGALTVAIFSIFMYLAVGK